MATLIETRLADYAARPSTACRAQYAAGTVALRAATGWHVPTCDLAAGHVLQHEDVRMDAPAVLAWKRAIVLGDAYRFAPERERPGRWYAVAADNRGAVRSFGPYATRDVANAACDTLAAIPAGEDPSATLEGLNRA